MKTKLDNLINEIQRGKPGQDTVASEMRSPFRDEFEQPVNGWMVEREKPELDGSCSYLEMLKYVGPCRGIKIPSDRQIADFLTTWPTKGINKFLRELIPIPDGMTIEPAAHNPEPNSSHYIDSVITDKKGKVLFDAKTTQMMFIVEDDDPCEYCSELSGTVGTIAEILGSEGIFPPMMCHGLIYDGKACQSSMVPVPISGDDNYQTNNIKIDPEVIYNAMSKSMLDVQDVVDCFEENLPPLSDIAKNGRFDVKYGDREGNMTNIIPKGEKS